MGCKEWLTLKAVVQGFVWTVFADNAIGTCLLIPQLNSALLWRGLMTPAVRRAVRITAMAARPLEEYFSPCDPTRKLNRFLPSCRSRRIKFPTTSWSPLARARCVDTDPRRVGRGGRSTSQLVRRSRGASRTRATERAYVLGGPLAHPACWMAGRKEGRREGRKEKRRRGLEIYRNLARNALHVFG